jgi:hypothetical protein
MAWCREQVKPACDGDMAVHESAEERLYGEAVHEMRRRKGIPRLLCAQDCAQHAAGVGGEYIVDAVEA